ncbi:DUF3127 domain-containing protein [Bacteroides heparinolyticus]|uniref:DUF3127 domain-containing protein n=1 Tax=Prevotella heparinolytica TaxID=28113 RepID=UPI0023EFE311|nr:DUF3127 domain-containing protein [Bacteroides heparinolyticus]
MHFEVEGKIIAALPPVTGVTKAGKDWEKLDFVLETSERYPKNIRFSMFSFDGPVEGAPCIGDDVRVRFIIEARKSNENWYNDVKAYQVESLKKQQ